MILFLTENMKLGINSWIDICTMFDISKELTDLKHISRYLVFELLMTISKQLSFLLVMTEKIFKYLPIRNKNCPWQPYFVSDHNEFGNLCTGRHIYHLGL